MTDTSLHTMLSSYQSLHPMENMAPYVPCWCLSGKKWKFCHKGRESKNPPPIGKIINEMRLSASNRYCAHPLAGLECGKIIDAHTIQRRGSLSEIAEDGHVYSVCEGAKRSVETSGIIIPRRVGYRSASTFAGLCDIHDVRMFAPIESRFPTLTKENVFLFSFRAIAYEQFSKRAAIEFIDVQRQLDSGMSFAEQAVFQENLHWYKNALKAGLANIDDWKSKYDNSYCTESYDQFSAYACLFDRTLPVASCGAFQPEISFSGEVLQIFSQHDTMLEHVAISLTPFKSSTLFTIGWFGKNLGAAELFVKSFMSLGAEHKSNASIHLAFEHL